MLTLSYNVYYRTEIVQYVACEEKGAVHCPRERRIPSKTNVILVRIKIPCPSSLAKGSTPMTSILGCHPREALSPGSSQFSRAQPAMGDAIASTGASDGCSRSRLLQPNPILPHHVSPRAAYVVCPESDHPFPTTYYCNHPTVQRMRRFSAWRGRTTFLCQPLAFEPLPPSATWAPGRGRRPMARSVLRINMSLKPQAVRQCG